MRAAVVGILATIAVFGAFPGAAGAASPADWMYEPTTFTEIRLTLPPASFAELEAHPEDEYVPGTFSIAETNGTPGEVGPFSPPIEVGIRLKGGLGSFEGINDKAAFKIKFDTVVDDQTFLGLEKMTLNNMVQDDSMVDEVLSYGAFHQMGVFAPNTGYAYVWVNGKSYGLHLNLETPDEIALEKRFGPFQGPPQHLYEGEYGADVSSEINSYTSNPRWEDLEVDEGESGDKSDLIALLDAVASGAGSFSERVAPYADLTQMTRMWMTERYIGHWDGYSGDLAGHVLPNNYYLYSDAAGKFQMLPWGTDQTWYEQVPFAPPAGVLFEGCISDPACAALYEDAGEDALTTLTAPMLDAAARCTAAAVQPWREFEVAQPDGKLPPYTLAETADAQADVRDFIAARPQQLATYLSVAAPTDPGLPPAPCPALRPIGGYGEPEPPVLPPPTPPTTPGDESDQGQGSGSTAGSGASPPAVAPPATPPPDTTAPGFPLPPRSTALSPGRRTVRANAVRLALRTPAPGRLALRGAFRTRTRTGSATACRGHRRVASAGPATVSCHFTAAFKRRLARGAAWIRLTATLKPAAGSPRSTTAAIRVPKR